MKKLKVAMLGCGGISGRHTKGVLARQDADLVACCDVSEAKLQAYAEKHLKTCPVQPAFFVDPAEMYRKTRPDAVVICTPHTLHYGQACQALEAGCHVLMEKPMVTSAQHAYDLRDRVRQAGKVFTVAYNTPCSPRFHYLREVIRTRQLGKLELVNGYISQDWLKLTTGMWRQQPELSGGGQAYDSGAHLLNSLCWSVESRIAQVFAFIDNCSAPVDINSAIAVRFANGVLASLAVSGNCASSGTHMVFIFQNGRIEIDGWGASWIKVFAGKEQLAEPPLTAKPLTPVDNFVDAIFGRDEPRTSPENGVIHSELMEAIYESARTGRAAAPRQAMVPTA